MKWNMIKMELKERFMNYEAAKGIYYMGAGSATVYLSLFWQQYVIQGLGCIFGWFILSEGLRKLLVNRIKLAIKTEELIKERKNAHAFFKFKK